jgi:hypothetical protein
MPFQRYNEEKPLISSYKTVIYEIGGYLPSLGPLLFYFFHTISGKRYERIETQS